jgi:AAA family ATP:ADP antiporter
MPALAVVIAFQAIQRTANFAISNPAREILFTVLPREQKYKAKNVIDVVVFRGADALGGWLFAGLRALGYGLPAISLIAIPAMAAWIALALSLGKASSKARG